jgi:hypothetical protein
LNALQSSALRDAVGLGAAHGFKLPRCSAGSSATSRSTSSPAFDLEPFRIDRPALTDADTRRHWLA